MTVSKVMAPLQYTTDGVQDNFPYDDKIFAGSDLEVYLLNSVNQETQAVLDQDYTVTGVGLEAGGAVVFTTPPAANQTVTVRRALPLLQSADYVENDDFPAQGHEDALDKLVMLAQQLHEQSNRCLHLPPSIQISGKLPAPEPNTVLAWDALGQAVVNRTTETLSVPQIDHIGNYEDSLAEAVLQIGAGAKMLMVNKLITLDSDLVVPENIQLWVTREGRIRVVNCSLTLQSRPECGPYHVFELSGTGAVTGLKSALPEWFGAVGDDSTDDTAALQATANASRIVWLLDKIYKITAGVIMPDNGVIDGPGTIHQTDDTKEGLIVKEDVTVRNIGLTGSMVAYGPHYLHVGIIPYAMRNGSGNDPATCALAAWASGNRMKIENVKFTAWDVAAWAGLDSTIQNCKATDNWREAFYCGGPGCRVLFNEIDGCDGWAIDFNAGDSRCAGNQIKNCGRVLTDGGGISFSGLTTEKPMTGLTAIGNNIDDCGVGYGIFCLSKPTDGVMGDVKIFGNTLNGKSTGVSLDAITVYHGAGSTTPLTDIQVFGNIAKTWRHFINMNTVTGGIVSNNTGDTFTPPTHGAMSFGAINSMVIGSNVCRGVAGVANTVMFIEGDNNNNRIVNNIGEGANVGFWNTTGATGTGNDISGNDFSGCTMPIYLQDPLEAGNRLERNTGYVPYLVAPAVPASTVEVQNNKGYPVVVKVTGGTVTVIATGSVSGYLTATGLTAGQLILPPGWFIAITYSSAPTWTWEGIQ